MRWTEILTESVKKFEPMFQMFRDEHGQMPPWVASRIRSVETLMKREDRSVWALRWERLNAVSKATNLQNKDAIMGKMMREVNVSGEDLERGLHVYETMMRDHFAHWFSLSIPKLHGYVFNRQSPDEIWAAFTELEEEWKKSRNQIINHAEHYPEVGDDDFDEDAFAEKNSHLDYYEREEDEEKAKRLHDLNKRGEIKKIIDFGDGWAWWDLNRTHCTIEGNAMGHCGNAPSKRDGDTVLSLRRDMGNGEYRPSLTFILHGNGMLGELKGRGNEKPAPRYHDMIVKLLENPMIEGCDGGGYASDHNFSVLDLPASVRLPLLKKKPKLLSLYDRMAMYAKRPSEKNQQEIVTSVAHDLRKHGLSFKRIDFTDTKRPKIIIDEWQSRDAYSGSYASGYIIDNLKSFFAGLEDDLMKTECDNWQQAEEIASQAHDEYFDNVFDAIIDYSHDNFLLSGVEYEVTEGKVRLVVSVAAYLSPSSDQYDYEEVDEDEVQEPILDRLGSLDETGYENQFDWSDVSENICEKLPDEVSEFIAHCAVSGSFNDRDGTKRKAVEAIYQRFANEAKSIHYHSTHPDQMSFDFPDRQTLGKR